MKKYGVGRKRLSRKKRLELKWRTWRARAKGVRVKKMIKHLDNRHDPLLMCRKIKSE